MPRHRLFGVGFAVFISTRHCRLSREGQDADGRDEASAARPDVFGWDMDRDVAVWCVCVVSNVFSCCILLPTHRTPCRYQVSSMTQMLFPMIIDLTLRLWQHSRVCDRRPHPPEKALHWDVLHVRYACSPHSHMFTDYSFSSR